jgi:hypothetical protein
LDEQYYTPPTSEPTVSRPSGPTTSSSPTSYPRSTFTQSSPSLKNRLTAVPWPIVAVAAVVVLLISVLIYGTFHTKSIDAMVTGFSWSRTVSIERYQQVRDSGWSLPSGAYNVSSETRIHHHEDIEETRTETVHHHKTCYRDLGSGAEESYDCSYTTTESKRVVVGSRPVYQTWYEYTVDKWVFNRSASAQSNDREPYWPEYTLHLQGQTRLGAERVGQESQTYSISFITIDSKEEEYVLKTSYENWLQYDPQGVYKLKINSFKAIMNNPLLEK